MKRVTKDELSMRPARADRGKEKEADNATKSKEDRDRLQ